MNSITKYKFADLYEMSSGISTTKDQAGHGAPFVSFSTVFNNYFLPEVLPDKMDTSEKEQGKFSVKKGDILITRTSETLDELAMSCVALKDYPEATFSGFVKRLRPKASGVVYNKFMAFYLRSELFRKTVTNNASMTLRASFNEDIFSFLNLYLPSYDEQVKIGNLLYNMEMKMHLNNIINCNLAKQVQTIYNYWFMQYNFPDENGNPYYSSNGSMEYDVRLKREIPSGWIVQSVANNDLCTLIKPGVDKFVQKTYLPTSEVNGTIISEGSLVHYETRESRANMQPTLNSVWFAKMKNSTKHLFINHNMQTFIDSTILSTGFCGLQCTKESFEYISSFIASNYFETVKNVLAHGATQEAVNNDDLKGIHLVIPDSQTLMKYHELTMGIYEQMSNNILENFELKRTRDWLLPLLINGQIELSN